MLDSESKKKLIERTRVERLRRKSPDRTGGDAVEQRHQDGRDHLHEERYGALIENIPCAVYSAFPGKAGPTTFMSSKWRDWTGYSPEELYQNPEAWPMCIHRDDREEALAAYAVSCTEGVPYCLEYRLVHKDTGQVRYVTDQGILNRNEEGVVVGVDGVVADITEQKSTENELRKCRDNLEKAVSERTAELSRANEILKLEDANRKKALDSLRESEEKFRTMFELSPYSTVLSDLEGNILACSHQFTRLHATAGGPGAQVGRNVSEFFPKEEWPALSASLKRTIAERSAQRLIEYTMLREDGMRFLAEARSTVVLDGDGEPCALLATAHDITDRRQAEEALRESEERLRLAVRAAQLNTWDVDLLTDEMHLGGHSDEVLGLDPDIKSMPLSYFWEHVSPDDLERVQQAADRAIDEGTLFDEEHRVVRSDGTERWVAAQGLAVYDKTGKAVRMIGVSRDITERRQSEESLRRSEQLFRTYFELGLVGMAVTSPEKGWTYVNDNLCKMLGYSREELVKMTWADLTHPDDLQADVAQFERALSGEIDTYSMDKRFIRKDGRIVHASLSVACVRQEDGSVEHFVAHLHDITDRKRAETALRDSERRYETVVKNAREGIVVVQDGRLRFVNPYIERAFGRTQEEMGSRPFIEFVHPDDRDRVMDIHVRRFKGEDVPPTYELRAIDNRGDTRWLESNGILIEWNGRPATLNFLRDITERKRAEDELKESEKRSRLLVDFASDSIFLLDMNGRFIDANPAACDGLGRTREEILDLSVSDIDPDWSSEEVKSFLSELVTGETVTVERTHRRKNKTSFPVEIRLTKVDVDGRQVVLALARDITQRRRTEESLRRKAEAVSQEDRVHVSGIDIEWDPGKGACTFEKLPVAMMWIDTTLAGLMSGVQATVGTERFALALQSEGRKSVEDDWQVISQFPDFNRGFEAIANIAAVAGWGDWRLIEMDRGNKECLFRVWNNWEGLYQKALGVSWGSGMLAGKLAGYCSMLFKANCWADQTAFVAAGDAFDEFRVHTSNRSVENEIENLLATDKATRADMAVALQNLRSEISARKGVEWALRESEQRMELALRGADLGTWDWNVKTGEVMFNERWAGMLGYTPDEIEPHVRTSEGLVHPDDISGVTEVLNAHLEGRTDFYESEHRMRHRSGGWIWVLDKGRVIDRDAEGKAVRVCGTHLDITEHRRAEGALRESEEKFRTLAEQSPNMIFINSRGRVVYANRRCEELTGYERDEFCDPDFDFLAMIAPECVDMIREKFARHMNGEDVEQYEYCLINRKGRRIEAINSSRLIQYEGEPAILGIVTDITDRKLAERALRESEKELDTIFNISPVAVILLDADIVVRKANLAATILAGRELKDILGLSLGEAFSCVRYSDDPRGCGFGPECEGCVARATIQDTLDTDDPHHQVEVVSTIERDGVRTEQFFLLSSTSLHIAGRSHVLATVENISGRKEAERKILEDREQLKSLASQLSRSEERERHRLATALHDQVGQSLVFSKLKLDQLRMSDSGGEVGEALREVCSRLTQVIQETRTLTFDLSSPILYELGLEAAVAEWLADEIEKKHGIETEFCDDGQEKPLDDDIRAILFRNVRELLVNTVKHAQAHKVKVDVRRTGTDICVSVEDDGIGFDPAEVKAMAAGSDRFGLFSIRERLEQLGGLIEIESRPGRGSRILMKAPLKCETLTDGMEP